MLLFITDHDVDRFDPHFIKFDACHIVGEKDLNLAAASNERPETLSDQACKSLEKSAC